jgi:DNA repair protein RecO (recombination protein O)
MARFRDQAICIRHLDWSETSQVVELVTRAHGKVRGLAKGSKRLSPSSVQRFSGGLDLLTAGELVAVIRPTSDLATITEWDLQQPWRALRADLEAQRLALYAADVCHALLADHDPHPGAFTALARFLDALTQDEPHARPAHLLVFQWALLTEVGYRPLLDKDAVTGAALSTSAALAFAPKAGGFTTQGVSGAATSMSAGGPWRVRGETVAVLRAVAAKENGGEYANPQALVGARGDDEAVAEGGANPPAWLAARGDDEAAAEGVMRANRLLCVYVRALVDRELPTMRFVLNGGK